MGNAYGSTINGTTVGVLVGCTDGSVEVLVGKGGRVTVWKLKRGSAK